MGELGVAFVAISGTPLRCLTCAQIQVLASGLLLVLNSAFGGPLWHVIAQKGKLRRNPSISIVAGVLRFSPVR